MNSETIDVIDYPEIVSHSFLIFKTDLKTKKRIELIQPLLQTSVHIESWTVDTDDIDNVLRIKTQHITGENDIIHLENNIISLLKQRGIYCAVLED